MKTGYRILVVDDEIEYQRVISLILTDAGYETATCSNGKEALEYLEKNQTNLILTDLKMPVMDGVKLIKKVRQRKEAIDIIVLTAFGSIESAVDVVKNGADDYFVKSGELEELLLKIGRLAKIYQLERKNSALMKKQNGVEVFLESKNERFLELLERCRLTADTDINILLLGDSGVGKEVIANYIHDLSGRREEPFVAVNCQAFPEGVIESELFGHRKGAFTGAVEDRMGKFEEANNGSLFLDEICDLPIAMQGKLLRTLEMKSIERVGGGKLINLDLRFISATNKCPEKEIANGCFREDLLYRINTLTLEIPSLRERKDDLPGLIEFFVKKIEFDQKKKIRKIDDNVMDFLLRYEYPGNVRELKNIIERMIALSRDGIVTIKEILMPIDEEAVGSDEHGKQGMTLRAARQVFEKDYISNALKDMDGNVAKCAEVLQISQRQMWNKINQYGIKRKE